MLGLYILIAILLVLAAFVAVLLIRTAAFKPKNEKRAVPHEEVFDKDAAVSALAELVKCKTVSSYKKEEEDEVEFEKLIGMLPKLYPSVFVTCELKKLEDRALLFRWKGKSVGEPAVLMAHYDVVPVNEDMWDKPPFDAIIENEVMWGRGTLDTKVTMNGVLSAANKLISDGFVPENDVYFAFSGGEEVNGLGALNIVNYFKEQNITLGVVVDEGGAVVENVFPGVKSPCALIGIAEKGMLNLEYTVKSAGGHASAPKPHTPVGVLSMACSKVEAKPFKAHITKPVAEMFDTLGRHSNFVYRMIFANLWCFRGVLDMIAKKSGGEMNALMRTTVAFTQMSGSSAPNVIPPEATMVSNIRLNPEDTVESAMEYIGSVIGDDSIKLTAHNGTNPSRISSTDCDGWRKVSAAVADTWQGSIVSPYLMVQCSDSRHYGAISDRVYRFSAMALTTEERATIHGNNERIRLDAVYKAVEFYIRLMRQL
ncbi:MAG: M20/M25/M40 family metallo-hydrolase [Clostridia bacterium]|nr:M20/M25/M40 family metallo-hydrolase [Clostridia bacterium]